MFQTHVCAKALSDRMQRMEEGTWWGRLRGAWAHSMADGATGWLWRGTVRNIEGKHGASREVVVIVCMCVLAG